jgi:CBS domain-containing protein
MRKTTKDLLAEYGTVALVVYLSIFVLVLAGFWVAIRVGWRTDGTAGNVGSLAAAYVAAKVTQPLRIAATVGADITIRCVARGRHPCLVSEIMTPAPLQTVGPEAEVSDIVRRMEAAGIRGLPVVRDGMLIGHRG